MQRRSSRVFSAYVPGSGGRERKRETVFAATYDDAVRLWTAFRGVKNRHVRPAVAPFFGNRRLNEISTAVVKSFQTKLNRSGYALATVSDYVTARRRSIAVSTRSRSLPSISRLPHVICENIGPGDDDEIHDSSVSHDLGKLH